MGAHSIPNITAPHGNPLAGGSSIDSLTVISGFPVCTMTSWHLEYLINSQHMQLDTPHSRTSSAVVHLHNYK